MANNELERVKKNTLKSDEELERVKKAALRYFDVSGELALRNLKIEYSDEIDTACVSATRINGKLVPTSLLVNKEFFDTLSFSQKVFVFSHEIGHLILKHFARSNKKPIKDAERKYEEYCKSESDPQKRELMQEVLIRRYNNIWNIAADAVINATLREMGLNFPEDVKDPKTGEVLQFVSMPEGYTKSTEKIYDYLVAKDEKNREEKEKNKDKESSNKQENGDKKKSNAPIDDIDVDNYKGPDSHKEWNNDKNNSKNQNENNEEQEEKEEKGNQEDSNESEDEIAKNLINNQKSKRGNISTVSKAFRNFGKKMNIGEVEIPKTTYVPWTRFISEDNTQTDYRWGMRRANHFYPNARVEEYEKPSMPDLEIILDTSGSVSDTLLKGFLAQIIPVFMQGEEEFTVKIASFGDGFSGFETIHNIEELKKFKPVRYGGTNFDCAAGGFSKSGNTKKIIFTDGYGENPTIRTDGVYWIMFGNCVTITPLGGTIINVTDAELKNMEDKGLQLIGGYQKTR